MPKRIVIKNVPSEMMETMPEEVREYFDRLQAIKTIHHTLDIHPRYKRETSWIALEIADESEDRDTFNKIFILHPLFRDHVRKTMGCFRWKFIGNEPLIESPWHKGESYDGSVWRFDPTSNKIHITQHNNSR
jgi:hypothetical protein